MEQSQPQATPEMPGPASSPPRASRRPVPEVSQHGRKGTQRPRLLSAMTTLAAERGYADVTIADVIALAGVSRPTFYEYFSDKDSCFLAALDAATEDLLRDVRQAVLEAPPAAAEGAVLSSYLAHTQDKPAQARLVFCEALAGGPRSLDWRDRLLSDTGSLLEQAHETRSPDSLAPDLPPHLSAATFHWSVSRLLRRSDRSITDAADSLTAWVAGYSRPVASHSWRSLSPSPKPPPSAFQSSLPAEAPGVLGPGRPRLSRGEVARNQRERILHATSKVAFEKGFAATSITEIASAADLDPRVFYSHFPDKLSAFLAAHELGFEHIMAVSAGAFFSVPEWPERVWRGILAGTQFQASHPVLTHMLYVQSYAIGSAGSEQIEDTHSAFALFLQEGAQLADAAPPNGVSDAVIAACFEIPFYLSRQGRGEEISRFAPLMTYLCLAPFLGPHEATGFIEAKLN